MLRAHRDRVQSSAIAIVEDRDTLGQFAGLTRDTKAGGHGQRLGEMPIRLRKGRFAFAVKVILVPAIDPRKRVGQQ